MRLQSIGDAIKNIYKHNKEILLSEADDNYWSSIIKLREIISHHYIDIDIDSEIIFDICKNELKLLEQIIGKVKKNHCS